MTIRSSMHLLSRDFMRAIDLKCTSDPISVPNCTRPVKLMIQRFVYISNDSKRKLIFVILIFFFKQKFKFFIDAIYIVKKSTDDCCIVGGL